MTLCCFGVWVIWFTVVNLINNVIYNHSVNCYHIFFSSRSDIYGLALIFSQELYHKVALYHKLKTHLLPAEKGNLIINKRTWFISIFGISQGFLHDSLTCGYHDNMPVN